MQDHLTKHIIVIKDICSCPPPFRKHTKSLPVHPTDVAAKTDLSSLSDSRPVGKLTYQRLGMSATWPIPQITIQCCRQCRSSRTLCLITHRPTQLEKNSLVGSVSIKSVGWQSVGRNLAQSEQSADGSHTNSCVSVVQVYAMVEQHLIQ